ncbi:MAG: SdrD B-like domain-containing protein [Usitatibacter sp.]
MRGWSAILQPGENLRILVDVRSPSVKSLAKAIVDSDVTTLVIMNAGSGALTVKDTTSVDDLDEPAAPQNAIRNFTDSNYSSPTPWGVVGGQLFLRANAQACNASPDAVDTRTVVITGPNGEREEVTAVETGANTGIFAVPMLPIRSPPVVTGNGILEGRANDVFTVDLQGCGRRIDTLVTLMEPVSVVFDSATNEPIAGARVTLVQASGGQCLGNAATLSASATNPGVTGADGGFAFPPAAGTDYCLAVVPPNGYRFASRVAWPLLPQGRNLNVSGLTSGGSYGNPFHLAAGGLVVVDIPLDAVAQNGLFVQKDASRTVAEVGEFVDYTVRVKNGTSRALDRADVMLVDDLPAGFAYVPGTARRDALRIADPTGGQGPRLTFNVGRLASDAQATLTYRVRIGPGAMQGDGTNRVQAFYSAAGVTTSSNVAIARVQVTGGVFSDKGFILGKVFMDCNANGVQDRGEEGVPGVRMFLEDGTSSTTDGLGKFSFYGVSNRTHVVKADRSTLPRGATLAAISSRHLGDGGSRIVDLKAGEMHRADFAVAGCEEPVVEEARKRVAALERRADETALAATQLATETRIIPDLKTLPASGEVSAAAPTGAPSSALPGSNPASHAPPASAELPRRAAAAPVAVPATVPEVPLEAAIADVDNTLAFLGPVDGATLRNSQSAVRVKGALGSTFELTVNGLDVPAKQVAKRSILESRGLQAWEYLGVDFNAGDNDLGVVQRDSFGNERGRASIKVLAPGRVARIALELAQGAAIADGRSPLPVTVSLFDARGLPVTARTPVTLDTSLGTWDVPGTDPRESGIDVMVEGGTGTFAVMAPIQPGEARIIASSGKLREEVRVHFMPELRSLVAAGVVEGIVNIRRLDSRSLVAARRQDGFERELLHLSRTSGDGRIDAGARAAFFLKGKIRGEYLLTAAYDSDKDTRERLFRDIQPDEFYPVYGDSAIRGYDAQSTARLYVRIDHKKSYLLYGDFNTQVETSVRRLSGYSRSLTGVREHYDNGRIQANVFASRDSTRQKIDEFRANGTSGPYTLSSAAGLTNSEKVEILTRDRNRPALVLATSPQARFFDYEIEPLTGRLLFKAPVPSVDQDLNPVSIRVTYEIDQGGPEFWVYGGDAQVKLGERVEVGASFAEDKNPADPFRLRGGYGMVRLGEHTTAVAEVARTEHEMTVGQGDAARIHIRHDGERLKAEAFVARTDPTFDNPGAYLAQGRGESGARLSLKIDEHTSLKAEALRTEDRTTHNVRDGYLVALERSFANAMKLELGLRHAREEAPAIPTTALAPGSTGTTPNEVTSVRARVTGPIPGVAGATVYSEVEVDVQDAGRKIVALGGDYPLANKGKLYFRHEFISSLTGPYGLNGQQRQNTTVLGLDTEYMKDARLFSEYRIHDAISGGDAEAAIGLRNLWSIAPGWRLGTTLERVQAFSGNGQNDNTAVAIGLEYVGSPAWKGSTRIELRDASTQQSLLHTVGFASRISREWTFLARNAISIQRNKGGELAGAQHLLERMQAGVAFRDADTDRVNALARVEHREERDDTRVGVDLRRSTDILSVHGDYKLSRPFMLSGHYAAKWTDETSNGIATRYRAQLAAGRATWEFAPKWDAGLAVSGLFGGASRSRQYAVGIEVGYLLATNLWLSAGYNVFGYHDDDLAAGDYTNKGAYLRLRYKFDEALLGTMGEGKR